MLETIVYFTNQNILTKRTSYARVRGAAHIDLTELKVCIGLIYLAGTLHANRISLDDLWGTDGHGVEHFRLCMSLRRFKFITRCPIIVQREMYQNLWITKH